MKKKLSIGLLTLFTITPLWAEEVDEIVVSATGIPTPISQISASVDVITAEDLERQQITYLQDALATVAGVSTYQSGGPGSTSNVFMRGMTGKYSGVYIDGVQINDPASQQAAWAYLPTHGLESVEVLRGSQGVLYGSEAIGGAVSLFTAYGGETTNQAVFESGSFGSESLSFSSRGESGKVGYGLFAQQIETDGISAASESNGNTEDDGYESLSAHGRAVINLSDQVSVDIALRSVSSEIETDAGFTPTDNATSYTDFDAVGGRLSVTYELANSHHTVSVGESEDVSSAYNASVLTTKGTREATTYRGVFKVSEQVDILFGYESEEEAYGTSDAVYAAETAAVMALLQYDDEHSFSASFALRQDDNEAFGRFDTSRVAIKKMFGSLGVRGSYGTGFRAPSLYELYGLSLYCAEGLCGNTALKPEESRSRDIGFIFEPHDNLYFEFGEFDISVSDFIKYGNVVPDVSDPCLSANSGPFSSATTCGKYEQTEGESRSSGYELRGTYQHSEATKVMFNFTKLDAEKENGQRDIRRPEDTLNVSVTHSVSEFLQMGGQLRLVRNTVDTNFSAWPYVDIDLDDYALLNLHASYQVNDRVKAYGRVENATDEDYETVLGYGTPGRAFYVGVSSSF